MIDPGKKILLVQLFSNGDCLYATAIARQIKADFPGCKLTWAIAPFCAHILQLNPYVDSVRIVEGISKTDVYAFRQFKKKIFQEKANGDWDAVFITHNMDDNLALYDGTVRGMILRAYPNKITVPVQPVLFLSDAEKQHVHSFVSTNQFNTFKNVILWEYAPQSGQSVLDKQMVMRISEKLVRLPSTCVVLSSANSFVSTNNIIDASSLTIRENAELSQHCTLLIGCSSGITWLCTSSAGKLLPMVQLLNPDADFLNAPSVDFNRNGISTESLIEVTTLNENHIFNCIEMILQNNFPEAKKQFNQSLHIQFNTTRKIVYNLMCYMEWKAIKKHYDIMTALYGRDPAFLKQFYSAIFTFPFKLIKNRFIKTFQK